MLLRDIAAMLDAPAPGPMVDVDRTIPEDAVARKLLARARELIAEATPDADGRGLHADADIRCDTIEFPELDASDPLVVKATDLLHTAESGGLVAAATDIGMLQYRTDKDAFQRTAPNALHRAAAAGDARAMYYLGRIYNQGGATDPGYGMATYWHAKAYAGGHPTAAAGTARSIGHDMLYGPAATERPRYTRHTVHPVWRSWAIRAAETAELPPPPPPRPELDAVLRWDDATDGADLPGTGAAPSADAHIALVASRAAPKPRACSAGPATSSRAHNWPSVPRGAATPARAFCWRGCS